MNKGLLGYPRGNALSTSLWGFPLGESVDENNRFPIAENMTAWWDFSNIGDMTLVDLGNSTYGISAIVDRSGNGWTLSQGTSGSRPTYGSRMLNNIYVPYFDGGDSLGNNSLEFGCPSSTPLTVYVPTVFDSLGSYMAPVAGNGNALEFRKDTADNFNVVRNSDGNGSFPTLPVIQAGKPYFLCVRVASDGTTGTLRVGQRAIAGGPFSIASPSAGIALGSRVSGGIPITGVIPECLIYAAEHTDAQIDFMYSNYLRPKWGLA